MNKAKGLLSTMETGGDITSTKGASDAIQELINQLQKMKGDRMDLQKKMDVLKDLKFNCGELEKFYQSQLRS